MARLRAVDPDERAAVPVSVEEAAGLGDTLGELRRTRLVIARKLDDPNCPARDIASLSKRLMEVAREIEAIEARSREEEQRGSVPDGSFNAEAI